MRIRTDGDKSFRMDHIENASEFYDMNKTASVVAACDDVSDLAEAIRTVLERDDLTHEQRAEIAATCSTHHIEFDWSASSEGVTAEAHTND